MTKRTKQIVLMAAVVLVAIIGGGCLYVYMWLKNSRPQTSGTIVIDGIDSPVEITYDKMGIPQIWAETEHDGYFALGYLHASDRMFQMDMARRMSQGRMSELLGEVTLETDKKQRAVGHNRIAKEALADLSAQNKMRLDAYADGVNTYKEVSGAPPFEYLLLGAEFENWTAYDCLALLSFQTWYSDALQNHDRFFQAMVDKIGQNKAATLCYNYPDWAPVTIPESKKLGLREFQSTPLEHSTPNPYLMSFASNGWVISPTRSASGHAMLSSDPHLHISQLPQFWYMVGLHIKSTELNVLGISTPGLPYIIMGHNGRAAWSFTAGGVQVTKNYLEKIDPDDTTMYQTPDGWKQFEYRVDTIIVSGQSEPNILTTKITRHGPVISEAVGDNTVTALHWAGFDIDLNLSCQSGFDLQSVSSFDRFRQIVASLGALNANWMYADINGDIGYQLGTPIFAPQINNNCLALPGWTDNSNWQEYFPQAKSPFSKNPKQGWLASCNNLAAHGNAFPQLSGSFAPDRILRISEILRNRDNIDIEFLKRIQLDRVDAYLRRWRTEIARILKEIDNHELADSMNNWDGSTHLYSRETAIVMTFMTQLKKFTFADELGDMYDGVRTIWLDHVYNDTSLHFWFDDMATEQVETRADITQKAMTKAVEVTGDKSWGDINSMNMQHPMAAVPFLGGLLELKKESTPWPGTAGTLNASYNIQSGDSTFQTIVGPSWRFLIDFADIDSALFVLPSGNSGNPMSPHFFDFNQMWRDGEYWNVPLSYERVKANAVTTLNFTPQTNQEN